METDRSSDRINLKAQTINRQSALSHDNAAFRATDVTPETA